jgi:hypothetical protein
MYKYLQLTQKPIIQSDIDFDNLTNINEFIHKIKDYDIGLFRVNSTPWRKICATLSYFSNERETYNFSYIFGVFLNYLYNYNSNNWFIDQLCLYLTENYFNSTLNPETNICSIYKFSKGVFNYSTPYKKSMLDQYKKCININTYNNSSINIYIYWHSGINNCPKVVEKCIKTWIIKNPNYKINILDDNSLFSENNININDIYDFLPNYDNLKNFLSRQSLSDIIRLFLLYKYGGLWVDATCFCNLPLTYWINDINKMDFFAYRNPGSIITPYGVKEERLIDSWFLYSNKSYIVDKWFHETVNRWNNVNREYDRFLYNENGSIFYFWVHFLFNNLYNTDKLFKNDFDKCAYIIVREPQFLMHVHHQHKYVLDKLTTETKNHIDNYLIPLYKLTWKFDKNIIDELNVPFKNSILYYLFYTRNMTIEHYE